MGQPVPGPGGTSYLLASCGKSSGSFTLDIAEFCVSILQNDLSDCPNNL